MVSPECSFTKTSHSVTEGGNIFHETKFSCLYLLCISVESVQLSTVLLNRIDQELELRLPLCELFVHHGQFPFAFSHLGEKNDGEKHLYTEN